VRHSEQRRQIWSLRIRTLASVRTLLYGKLTGVPSRRAACVALGLLAVAGTLVLASPAAADGRIGSTGGAISEQILAGGISRPAGLAVSKKEGGDVYLADGSSNQRIDQFHPDGTFVRAFGWGVLNGALELQTCTTATGCQGGSEGSGPGQLDWSEEIAIANDPADTESYGDVYVVDQRNFRVEKYSPTGELLLIFGGGVDHTTGADLCTAADIAGGDTCGAGVPGTGAAHFHEGWNQEHHSSIAVGPGGAVYVGDFGRVQEFDQNGAFTGELTLPDAEPRFVTALAVDSSGDVFERSTVPGQVPGVREYSPAHEFLRTFDSGSGSEPTHLSLDFAGDLILSDQNGGEFTFRAFKSGGALYAEFTSDQVTEFDKGNHQVLANGIAVGDAQGKLYVTTSRRVGVQPNQRTETYVAVIPLPEAGPPLVSEEEATNLQPKTATLHAIVNPREFDTHYHFEFITDANYKADGNEFGAGTEPPTASVDLGPIFHQYPVQAPISGLTTNTLYHYRLVAESTYNGHTTVDGPTESFETLPPVSVRNFTTQTVGPELVTLKAELNANGESSPYTICYGSAPGSYTEGCSSGTLPTGNEFLAREATFRGLQPNTTYHYQLAADNENGEVKTPDQAFTTELSAAEERAVEDCPNTILREENDSLALPDCRAYEQTTEPDKEGGEAFPTASLAPGGERLFYLSEGVFAGAVANELAIPYLSQRTPSGWLTQPIIARLAPPGTEPTTFDPGQFSPEMDRWLFAEVPALNHYEAVNEATAAYLSIGFADGRYLLRASPTVSLLEGSSRNLNLILASASATSSDDLSRVYLVDRSRLLPSPGDPRPDDYGNTNFKHETSRIYELSGIGGPAPAIALIAEVPLGLEATDTTACLVDGEFPSTLFQDSEERLVSSDGSTIIYTAPIENVGGMSCGEKTPNPIAFFAHHVGQSSSVQLNAPPDSQCESTSPCHTAGPADPTVDGISPDGTRAWFTTTQPLVDSDTDGAADLYLAELGPAGELTQLIQASAGQAGPDHPVPGQGAGVQGVVRVSPDGSHVAFVASGVLTAEPNQSTGQAAASGADNLYIYDAAGGETKFVARLCSGTAESGSVPDPACPAGVPESYRDSLLWFASKNGAAIAKFTPDGRYLLLPSPGRLTLDDTDSAVDLYRYDFQTGRLIRVSFGHDGNDANGNDDAYRVKVLHVSTNDAGSSGATNQLAEDATRAISADGSTVIFETAAPLVSRDTNAGAEPGCGESAAEGAIGCDVYQWQESGHGTCHEAAGCISLVSDGIAPNGAGYAVISSSGRDIIFHTQRGEVPADTDGVGDIYDARENGGFPRSVEPPCHVSSSHCPGPESSPPTPPTIGTETFVGPGNSPEKLHCGKGRHRVTKHGQERCVLNSPKKHHHKKHKRANTNRRAGR
jgi:hypothetical protein